MVQRNPSKTAQRGGAVKKNNCLPVPITTEVPLSMALTAVKLCFSFISVQTISSRKGKKYTMHKKMSTLGVSAFDVNV